MTRTRGRCQGQPVYTGFVFFCGVRVLCVQLFHSHFPLEAQRLLHVVLLTAQADEADVGGRRHVCFVLLLHLQSLLQFLAGESGQWEREVWLTVLLKK